jgi:hypothetical protein
MLGTRFKWWNCPPELTLWIVFPSMDQPLPQLPGARLSAVNEISAETAKNCSGSAVVLSKSRKIAVPSSRLSHSKEGAHQECWQGFEMLA